MSGESERHTKDSDGQIEIHVEQTQANSVYWIVRFETEEETVKSGPLEFQQALYAGAEILVELVKAGRISYTDLNRMLYELGDVKTSPLVDPSSFNTQN